MFSYRAIGRFQQWFVPLGKKCHDFDQVETVVQNEKGGAVQRGRLVDTSIQFKRQESRELVERQVS